MTQYRPNSASLPLSGLPRIITSPDQTQNIPDEKSCEDIWNNYAMPEHIRAHCRQVAAFGAAVGELLRELGAGINIPALKAAALLHDLGKNYSIKYGGSHAQYGAAWVIAATRNRFLAQAVLHHVRWPWEIDVREESWLPCFCLIYADKRVMHDQFVSLETRCADLLDRYGTSPEARESIKSAHRQGLKIEAALSDRAGVPLHEYTFDRGRLVQRTGSFS